MRLHTASLALATVITALGGSSIFDGAFAQQKWLYDLSPYSDGRQAKQPNTISPAATSRPSSDMRGTPSMGGPAHSSSREWPSYNYDRRVASRGCDNQYPWIRTYSRAGVGRGVNARMRAAPSAGNRGIRGGMGGGGMRRR
jgi:hypothetical protein